MRCRGLGGKGVKVQKHGECLLRALLPHLEELRDVHAAAFEGRSSLAAVEKDAKVEAKAEAVEVETAKVETAQVETAQSVRTEAQAVSVTIQSATTRRSSRLR